MIFPFKSKKQHCPAEELKSCAGHSLPEAMNWGTRVPMAHKRSHLIGWKVVSLVFVLFVLHTFCVKTRTSSQVQYRRVKSKLADQLSFGKVSLFRKKKSIWELLDLAKRAELWVVQVRVLISRKLDAAPMCHASRFLALVTGDFDRLFTCVWCLFWVFRKIFQSRISRQEKHSLKDWRLRLAFTCVSFSTSWSLTYLRVTL